VGIDGPKMSVSRMPARYPLRAKLRARLTAIVLFPTPPFADDTATIFFTSLMLLLCGKPRWVRGICGGAPERGSPYRESDTEKDRHNSPQESYQRVLMLQLTKRGEQAGLQHGMVVTRRRGGLRRVLQAYNGLRLAARTFCGVPKKSSFRFQLSIQHDPTHNAQIKAAR